MKNTFSDLRVPASLGTLLVIPIMLLEWFNRRSFNEAFPFGLFALLWLLPATFTFILGTLIRNLRAPNGPATSTVVVFFGGLALILLAWLWGSILFDQMPCFLGLPNCD